MFGSLAQALKLAMNLGRVWLSSRHTRSYVFSAFKNLNLVCRSSAKARFNVNHNLKLLKRKCKLKFKLNEDGSSLTNALCLMPSIFKNLNFNKSPLTLTLTLALTLTVFLSSCSKSVMPSEYAALVSSAESVCIQKQCLDNELCVRAFYKPHDFLVLNEVRSEEVNRDDYLRIKEELGDLIYVTFSYYTNSGENPVQYLLTGEPELNRQAVRQLIETNIAHSITAVANGSDTLSCVIHHLEQTYGMSPYESVNLAFSAPSDGSDWQSITLHYHDFLRSQETKTFHFNKSDIDRLPSLKLQRS